MDWQRLIMIDIQKISFVYHNYLHLVQHKVAFLSCQQKSPLHRDGQFTPLDIEDSLGEVN